MLFKLSIKNIKKSIKDYSIYFFTLVFSIAMFYMFNSLDAQTSMLALNSSKYKIVEALIMVLNYVSIFVSIVLGFLIVYSNNFLIKKRKKEIGLYYTLGMSKSKVSFILVLETIFIGLISLVVGLLLGVFLSQFLSILTSKLFEVDMTSFKFIFSKSAFNKAIIYFTIIYIFVIIFNIFTLSRYKLIDLLHASKKGEKVKIRNKYLTAFTFILSIGLLGYAYYLLFDNALMMMDKRTLIMILSGALGTLLLFFSLSGFLLTIFQKIKNIYYKKLNIFVLRNVNSKINTSVISTTVICLMLLLTIGCLSGSMSLASAFNQDITNNNLTDYTIKTQNQIIYVDQDLNAKNMNNDAINKFDELLKSNEFNKYTKSYALLHKYNYETLNVRSMMHQSDIDKLIKEYGSNLVFDFTVPIIKESEYKEFMKLTNQEYIDIKDNEYLLLVNIDFIINAYKGYYEGKDGIEILGKTLKPGSDKIIKTAIENYTSAGNDGVIVVSDELVEDLELADVSLVGNFNEKNPTEEYEDKFENYLASVLGSNYDFRTRTNMESSSIGIKSMLIFVGLYLGITFAISSATILAIGQLSESSDNKERYKVLRQIGSDQKEINKALFTQIAITFMFPLLVALIHSYFGLKEINSLIISIGNIDLTSNIILTVLFMIIVYGGYFILTYLISKNIIKENN